MKIKIDNKTWFNSADIRKIVRAALTAEGITGNQYLVEVRYSRRGGSIGGWGWYHWKKIKMCIPKHEWNTSGTSGKEPWQFSPWRVKEFAQVMVHEFGHNLGLRHGEMCRVSDIDVDWCEGMTIGVNEPPKKKTPTERSAERETKARARVEELEKEIKRKNNLLKKWRTKVRYYDRKNKAAGKMETE